MVLVGTLIRAAIVGISARAGVPSLFGATALGPLWHHQNVARTNAPAGDDALYVISPRLHRLPHHWLKSRVIIVSARHVLRFGQVVQNKVDHVRPHALLAHPRRPCTVASLTPLSMHSFRMDPLTYCP
jgi:hypothetical protein